MSSLVSIAIPASVTSIGSYAFSGTSLTSLTLPMRLATISKGAFELCTSLSQVSIPESVTTIQAQAFNGRGLTSIIIPDSVNTVGNNAFRNNSIDCVIWKGFFGNETRVFAENPLRGCAVLSTNTTTEAWKVSDGAIAGIIVGGTVLLLVLILILVGQCKKKNDKDMQVTPVTSPPERYEHVTQVRVSSRFTDTRRDEIC